MRKSNITFERIQDNQEDNNEIIKNSIIQEKARNHRAKLLAFGPQMKISVKFSRKLLEFLINPFGKLKIYILY